MKHAILLLAVAWSGPVAAVPPADSCTPGPYIAFFDRESAALDADAIVALERAREGADVCGPMEMLLVGHADTSERPGIDAARAEAARNYFVAQGISEKRIFRKAVGAAQPRIPTPANTPELQNRRVEISIGSYGS